MTTTEFPQEWMPSYANEANHLLCPLPCDRTKIRCPTNCEHWWGQHNISCPACSAVSKWRQAHGFKNEACAPGPENTEVIEQTREQLLELERLLAKPLPVARGPFVYEITVVSDIDGMEAHLSFCREVEELDRHVKAQQAILQPRRRIRIREYEYKDEWYV